VLVGASGFSYEEAAKVADCAVGTMKSRVSRARLQLQQMLEGEKTPAEAVEHVARKPAAADHADRRLPEALIGGTY